ncbi:glycosyltransferase family 2 protein [Komarekiella sp. 'clone 1']|uniref:Glycosyltransferase family 2 protein n=1 Tax=Komarekiella delphini-convector SJRDD-AB1 TaxID=2593771 RepID=A0AA40T3H2_9NOST|nr:glycosyltransferase family 2 protein [Komarekiella delphini-convector]MBD6619993.1 glycosyltransferase family 2 protein [Komarekiella delphini-convector SJRDD-AB1]
MTNELIKHKLAVIMTCYNRRDTTLACLCALYQQTKPFDIYLTDDGSSDGTSDAIKSSYPQVQVLKGDGNLFWVGGMRLAFAEALKKNYDYYLWLNDDTIIESNALSKLLATHHYLTEHNNPNSIIVGSTQDAVTGKPTYGGAVRSKHWYSNKYEFVQPSQELQECDTMYGNCILIPRSVAERVGNLDPAFIHNLGDLDYGLRARKLGCSIWIAPGYVGTCSKNSVRGSWVDANLPINERLKRAFDIKSFPIKAWTVFTMRHSGSFWFLYWFLPYLRAVMGYKNLNVSSTFREEIN